MTEVALCPCELNRTFKASAVFPKLQNKAYRLPVLIAMLQEGAVLDPGLNGMPLEVPQIVSH